MCRLDTSDNLFVTRRLSQTIISVFLAEGVPKVPERGDPKVTSSGVDSPQTGQIVLALVILHTIRALLALVECWLLAAIDQLVMTICTSAPTGMP